MYIEYQTIKCIPISAATPMSSLFASVYQLSRWFDAEFYRRGMENPTIPEAIKSGQINGTSAKVTQK